MVRDSFTIRLGFWLRVSHHKLLEKI